MDKQAAIEFFGGLSETAEAIGCTRQSIYDWPDPLPRRIADRVIAAIVRAGKPVPDAFLALPEKALASATSEAA